MKLELPFFVLAVLFVDDIAKAKSDSSNEDSSSKTLGYGAYFGVGGPVSALFIESKYKPLPLFHSLGLRARFPGVTKGLRIETSCVIPSGCGVNLLFDVWHREKVRWHFFDLGLFLNIFQPVSVKEIERILDFTIGAGVEIWLGKRLWLMFDWRVFIPNPMEIYGRFRTSASAIYNEAWISGQTWLSFSYAW